MRWLECSGVSPDDPLMATVRGQMKAGVPAPIAFAEAKNTLQMRQEASKATAGAAGRSQECSFEQLRDIAAPILAEKDATKKQQLLEAAHRASLPGRSLIPSSRRSFPAACGQLRRLRQQNRGGRKGTGLH
jgi:hypothetical protein